MSSRLLTGEAEADALAACDAEPIRTPGSIQPHGGLLVTDIDLKFITHVSENINDFLSVEPRKLLGSPLSAVLTPSDEHALRNALSVTTIAWQREFLGCVGGKKSLVQAAVHVKGNRVILDLSRQLDGPDMVGFGLERLRWLLSSQTEDLALDDALDGMVKNLRAVSGFDRVVAYRFRPDGSGQVVAEARTSDMESYLSLRFPSQDIPKNARAICLDQPVRCIANVEADDVALLAVDRFEPPLDLTLTEYRGTSPVHLQYLRNMQVGASLTLPVVVDGALWGLFSCHHRSPKFHTIAETMTFDLVGRILTTSVMGILRRTQANHMAQCLEITQTLRPTTMLQSDEVFLAASWDRAALDMMRLFCADGILLAWKGKRHIAGIQPPQGTLDDVGEVLLPQPTGGMRCASDLRNGSDRFGPVAGALQLALGDEPSVGFWLFRAEENEVVHWAGSPDKNIETTATDTRLHPRSSFQHYQQQSKGCSRAWEPDELLLATAFSEAIRQAIDRAVESAANDAVLRLMVQEANHRNSNTLSIVRSIMRQSADRAKNIGGFLQVLDARLAALAKVQALFEAPDGPDQSLRSIIERELAPFQSNCVRVSGPEVQLQPVAATMLALAWHEIIANSAKYGALNASDASIEISWNLRARALRLQWSERVPFKIPPPAQAGFGFFLIEEGLQHQLDCLCDISFRDEGLDISIDIPLAHTDPSRPAREPQTDRERVAGNEAAFDFGEVLVLEDDFLISEEIRTSLISAGASAVSVVASNAAAVGELNITKPTCAVVDVRLGDEDSLPTVAHLQRYDVPFVFVSGYSIEYSWLSRFKTVPRVKKPFQPGQLVAALRSVLTQRNGT